MALDLSPTMDIKLRVNHCSNVKLIFGIKTKENINYNLGSSTFGIMNRVIVVVRTFNLLLKKINTKTKKFFLLKKRF
jgi:hypothetical protein